MSGWIKLHRKITEWEWYSDLPCRVLFLHLLVSVENEPKVFRGENIPRGGMLTGRLSLSKETGLSEQELRTALQKLRSTGEVEIRSTNKYSVVTLCNYEKYQQQKDDEQPANEQPAKRHTSNQQNNQQSTSATIENLTENIESENDSNQQINTPSTSTPTTSKEERSKEKKECSIEARFDEFWKQYPRKENKKKAFDAWKRNKCYNGKFETIMAALEQHKQSPQWQDSKFVPFPTSWINGARWEDEILMPPTGKQCGEIRCPLCDYRASPACKDKPDAKRIGCTSFFEARP